MRIAAVFFLSVAAGVAGTGALAGSLERPVVEPVVYAPAEPAFTWEGGYVGAQIGYLRGDMRLRGENLNNNNTMESEFNPSGATLGIYAGYNWQGGGNTVFGFEGEINYADANAVADGIDPPSFGFMRDRIEGSIRSTGALRGRVGFAQDRTLFYLTGGVAFADARVTGYSMGGASPFDERSTRTGWTIGAGIEHAVNDRMSVRLDYRFADFGTETIDFVSGRGTPHEFDWRLRTNEIRAGVAFRF